MAKKHKDWFDRDCAIRLGEAIKANYAAFDSEGYADEVDDGVGNLELKDRGYVHRRLLAHASC